MTGKIFVHIIFFDQLQTTQVFFKNPKPGKKKCFVDFIITLQKFQILLRYYDSQQTQVVCDSCTQFVQMANLWVSIAERE
jgi:lipid-A-disaccharide synthase-like uncharacterized protein